MEKPTEKHVNHAAAQSKLMRSLVGPRVSLAKETSNVIASKAFCTTDWNRKAGTKHHKKDMRKTLEREENGGAVRGLPVKNTKNDEQTEPSHLLRNLTGTQAGRHEHRIGEYQSRATTFLAEHQESVINAANQFKNDLLQSEKEIAEHMSHLEDHTLPTLSMPEIENIWECVAAQTPMRENLTEQFEENLLHLEGILQEKVAEEFKLLRVDLCSTNFMLPDDVERVIQGEQSKLNLSILESRRKIKEILAQLLSTDLEKEGQRRTIWGRRARDWRKLKHEHALNVFKETVALPEFTNPPSRQSDCEAFTEVQRGLLAERVGLVHSLMSLNADQLTEDTMSQWLVSLENIRQNLSDSHGTLLENLKHSSSLTLGRLSELIEELQTSLEVAGDIPSAEADALIHELSEPVIEKLKLDANTFISQVETYTSLQRETAHSSVENIGQYVLGAAKLRDAHLCEIDTLHHDFLEHQRLLRTQHDDAVASKEAKLLETISLMENEHNAEKLKSLFTNVALVLLKDIENLHRSLHDNLVRHAEEQPAIVLASIEKYQTELWGALNVSPDPEKVTAPQSEPVLGIEGEQNEDEEGRLTDRPKDSEKPEKDEKSADTKREKKAPKSKGKKEKKGKDKGKKDTKTKKQEEKDTSSVHSGHNEGGDIPVSETPVVKPIGPEMFTTSTGLALYTWPAAPENSTNTQSFASADGTLLLSPEQVSASLLAYTHRSVQLDFLENLIQKKAEIMEAIEAECSLCIQQTTHTLAQKLRYHEPRAARLELNVVAPRHDSLKTFAIRLDGHFSGATARLERLQRHCKSLERETQDVAEKFSQRVNKLQSGLSSRGTMASLKFVKTEVSNAESQEHSTLDKIVSDAAVYCGEVLSHMLDDDDSFLKDAGATATDAERNFVSDAGNSRKVSTDKMLESLSTQAKLMHDKIHQVLVDTDVTLERYATDLRLIEGSKMSYSSTVAKIRGEVSAYSKLNETLECSIKSVELLNNAATKVEKIQPDSKPKRGSKKPMRIIAFEGTVPKQGEWDDPDVPIWLRLLRGMSICESQCTTLSVQLDCLAYTIISLEDVHFVELNKALKIEGIVVEPIVPQSPISVISPQKEKATPRKAAGKDKSAKGKEAQVGDVPDAQPRPSTLLERVRNLIKIGSEDIISQHKAYYRSLAASGGSVMKVGQIPATAEEHAEKLAAEMKVHEDSVIDFQGRMTSILRKQIVRLSEQRKKLIARIFQGYQTHRAKMEGDIRVSSKTAFSKELDLLYRKKDSHESSLNVGISHPQRAKELQSICDSESQRSTEELDAINARVQDAMSKITLSAQGFLNSLNHVTSVLLTVLDHAVFLEDLRPFNEPLPLVRQNLRHLMKVRLQSEEPVEKEKSEKVGKDSRLSSVEKHEKQPEKSDSRPFSIHSWTAVPSQDLLTYGIQLSMDDAQSVQSGVEREDSPLPDKLGEKEPAKDGRKKKGKPKDSISDSASPLKKSDIQSLDTPSHRSVLVARDKAFSSYFAHHKAAVAAIEDEGNSLKNSHEDWSVHWEEMISNLSNLDL